MRPSDSNSGGASQSPSSDANQSRPPSPSPGNGAAEIAGSRPPARLPPGGQGTVLLDRLIEGPHKRESGEDVTDLMESIRTIGLLHPLVVRSTGAQYEVVAGHRRLRALRALGWSQVRVTLLPDREKVADIASLDENLVRAQLSKSERAEALAQQKNLYEELNPNARHGGSRSRLHDANLSEEKARSYCQTAALATGKSPSTISRQAKIGEHGIPALKKAWDAGEITEVQAAKTASLPPEDQEAEVARLIAAKLIAAKTAANDEPPTVQPSPSQVLPSAARTQTESGSDAVAPSPEKDAAAKTESELTLADRALSALERWRLAVVDGQGTEFSLGIIEKARRILDGIAKALPAKPSAVLPNDAALVEIDRVALQ